MRFAFRRSALFAAASLIALGLAAPSMAQEAPQTPPVQDEQVPTEPSTAPDAEPAQEPEAADEAPTEPEVAPIPAVWAPIPTDAGQHSAYGLYLAGRNALTSGESAAGADYLARVEALTPEQPRVREQAFTAALLAGDLDVAGRIAPEGEGFPRSSSRRDVWFPAFRPSSGATRAAPTPCSRPRPSGRRMTARASMSRPGSPLRPATGTGRLPRRRPPGTRSAFWWRAAIAPDCWNFIAGMTRPTPNGAT